MEELNFKVSSELKNILGRDLITDDYIAILELVKNSYDAHATKVEITFDDNMITVADNGKGMTFDDITNKWLFVGYSAKRDGTEDKENNNYRNKIKRNYAGAKGIGRLSCDRLAEELSLITKSQESTKIEILDIDWSRFESNQKDEFDTIKIPYRSIPSSDIFPINSESGTILQLKKLHSNWNLEKKYALRKYLEKLINPFAETDNFCIEIISNKDNDNDEILKREIEAIKSKKLSSTENDDERLISDRENKIVNGIIKNTITDVLSIKTTQIESILKDGKILTKLTDRGTLMYEIEENNAYSKLSDVTINLYYLNRAAKYNFSLKMGVQPIQYGSVFLFRNGFRILPYGDERDDSWGLNQRVQQGYNRFLGTRDLFGRVDVETDNVDNFKEVSSRDGGLIKSESSEQLFEYFSVVHHRLERYVSGVLWGEAFLRNEYFKNVSIAKVEREKLQSVERESESAKHIYSSIGSKVDFLQLIKSLVNENGIIVRYYNTDLADIVSNISDTEIIQGQFIDDLEKLANSTNNNDLIQEIGKFKVQLEDLRKKKEDAERRLREEELKRQEAEERAKKAEEQRALEEEKRQEAEKKFREEKVAKEEAELKQREEEAKRKDAELKRKEAELKQREEEAKRKDAEEQKKKAENERDIEKSKNKYLISTRHLTPEVEDILHTIKISASHLSAAAKKINNELENLPESNIVHKELGQIFFHVQKIEKLSILLTKADINILKQYTKTDIPEYLQEYLPNYKSTLDEITFKSNCENKIIKKVSLLDLSVIMDNLISNSIKAEAKKIHVEFSQKENQLIIDFSDNGDGLNLQKFSPDDIFERGITDKRGGSGIGLSTIKETMKRNLNGDIYFLGNGLFYKHGATFRLVFK